MEMTGKDFSLLLPKVIFSLLVCLVIGFIVWQSDVFHWYSTAFRFVMFGFIGYTFFLILRLDQRNAWAFLIVASVINASLITRTAQWPSVLGYILFTGAISAALYFYSLFFFRKTSRQHYLEPIILAVLFAIGSVIVDSILAILREGPFELQLKYIWSGVWYFFMMGFGIGLSILFTDEPLWSRLRKLIR